MQILCFSLISFSLAFPMISTISNIRYLFNTVPVTVIRSSSFLPTDFFLTTQSAVFELECSIFQAKNCSCKSFKSVRCFLRVGHFSSLHDDPMTKWWPAILEFFHWMERSFSVSVAKRMSFCSTLISFASEIFPILILVPLVINPHDNWFVACAYSPQSRNFNLMVHYIPGAF